MVKFTSILFLVLSATLLTGACTKGARTENSTSTSQANRPEQSASASPLIQPTLKGDIERISLSISMAREAFKNNKLQDVVGQLRGANQEVDTALGRKPRLSEEFEALKAAIDRTIGAVERGDKGADAQLAELQVRIGAIKTNTP